MDFAIKSLDGALLITIAAGVLKIAVAAECAIFFSMRDILVALR